MPAEAIPAKGVSGRDCKRETKYRGANRNDHGITRPQPELGIVKEHLKMLSRKCVSHGATQRITW